MNLWLVRSFICLSAMLMVLKGVLIEVCDHGWRIGLPSHSCIELSTRCVKGTLKKPCKMIKSAKIDQLSFVLRIFYIRGHFQSNRKGGNSQKTMHRTKLYSPFRCPIYSVPQVWQPGTINWLQILNGCSRCWTTWQIAYRRPGLIIVYSADKWSQILQFCLANHKHHCPVY